MKTYMLTYHWGLPSSAFDVLEKAGVDEWIQVWPGMVLFKGDKNQAYYAAKINERNKISMFIVAEYDTGKSTGWMPPQIWEWIKPNSAPATPPSVNAEPQMV